MTADVILRRTRKSDRAWLDGWFAAWARQHAPAVADANVLLEAADATVSIITRDHRSLGVIASSAQGDAGTIHFVAIMPAETRRGVGMQAAAAVERSLTVRGVRKMFAPASEAHGISVYFWIRLGYRPLLRTEWPSAQDGIVWMRRDVDARQKKGSQSRIALKTSSP